MPSSSRSRSRTTSRREARGVEQDPDNPIYAEYGRKALVGWLRSHPEVARRWHADLLEDPAWNPGR